eukprot:1335790-Pyramimonas_sp.AAC.1
MVSGQSLLGIVSESGRGPQAGLQTRCLDQWKQVYVASENGAAGKPCLATSRGPPGRSAGNSTLQCTKAAEGGRRPQ